MLGCCIGLWPLFILYGDFNQVALQKKQQHRVPNRLSDSGAVKMFPGCALKEKKTLPGMTLSSKSFYLNSPLFTTTSNAMSVQPQRIDQIFVLLCSLLGRLRPLSLYKQKEISFTKNKQKEKGQSCTLTVSTFVIYNRKKRFQGLLVALCD